MTPGASLGTSPATSVNGVATNADETELDDTELDDTELDDIKLDDIKLDDVKLDENPPIVPGPEAAPKPEPAPPAEETTPQPTNNERTVTGGNRSAAEQQARFNETAAVTATNLTARTLNVTDTTALNVGESNTVEGAVERSTVDENSVFTSFTLNAEPTENLAAVTMASPVTATFEQPLLQRVVVNLLSSLGIGALASGAPSTPLWSPFAMALLALGSRREFTQPVTAQTKTVGTSSVATLTAPEMATAAVAPTYPGTTRTPVAVSGNTDFIEFVTGAGNLNNTINRFGIGGTDLGIMWDNGIEDDPTTAVDEHQILIAFGDTFSSANPVRTGVWRFNTLFRSADDVLNNGLYVPNGTPYDIFSGSPMENPNWSDPILPSPGQPVHPPYAKGPEVTIIPTAGVSVPYDNAYGARQYMSFMSVRSWDSPGRWTTNYSGIAYSDDNGQTWRIAPTSIRTAAWFRATVPYVSGNENFQQMAFVKPPEGSPEAEQGWVYAYGTPSGRGGTIYLSRVQETQIADTTKYEYWDGTKWVANKPSAAKPILPGKTTSFFGFFKRTTYPTASEMSVQYNPYLDKYVMLYGDSSNNIVMRTADSPQGTWSEPTVLVTAQRVPSLYAPYIHPWSGTENLPESEEHYLYWNLSTYNDYQVRLMRTDLTKIQV
ncbi:hypothetical protein MGAD_47040 [Mycolicibacterium gadium]|uniref:DUF4185 domain-containing protein n=1 Tax=Mycolicibacterium gadium TaxID=1794 RepID=A0A7I7WRS4_MYCGU|nr:hypothetical protein MGAD_47040 [Mycolicibacterium gadium]